MSASRPLRWGPLWALASGGLLALAYPKADLGVLAFVALVPLLLSLRHLSPAAAAMRGLACGGAFFGILLYWIPAVMIGYGGLAAPLAWLILLLLVAYLAGYFALFALIVSVSHRRFGALSLMSAPFVWVAL